MDTKIIIREVNLLTFKKDIPELENTITQYLQNGYKVASSNMTTINNIKFSFYVIMVKD